LEPTKSQGKSAAYGETKEYLPGVKLTGFIFWNIHSPSTAEMFWTVKV
jgi:hypothetical protein